VSELGRAVDDVREKIQFLIQEEIALAKAELSEKMRRLAVGAVFGIIAGAFGLFALIYIVEALAWGIYDAGWAGTTHYWWGFLIAGVLLILLGVILGLVAVRVVKRAVPPTPQMAIEEGKLIRETLQNPHPVEARVPAAPDKVGSSPGGRD
jgi:putative superfamily III holin-X